MGQSCSTNKTKSKKKLYISEQIVCHPGSPAIKKPFTSSKYLHFRLINNKTTLDTKSLKTWQKNCQRCQRMDYTEIDPNADEENEDLLGNLLEPFEFDHYRPGFVTFTKNPSSSKYFKHASFFFENVQKFENMNRLFILFKSPKTINNLTLSFSNHKKINEEAIIHLCEGLKRLVSLKSLTIDLSKCELLKDKVIEKLGRSLKQCNQLEVFSIDISDGKFTNESIHHVGRSIRHLSKLKSFSIKARGLMFWHPKPFEELYKGLEKKCQLKQLTLCFNHIWLMMSQEFEQISQRPQDLESLERLVLNFESCIQIDIDRALGSIGNVLKRMNSLVDLEVWLGECRKKGQSEDLKEFLICLKGLPKFTNVMIELKNRSAVSSWTRDEYQGFEDPRFYFSSHPEITIEEVKSVTDLIKESSRFTRIVLNLEGCKKHSDVRLELLEKVVTENSVLKHLVVDFSDCFEITDKKLIKFGQILSSKELESIKLRFYAAGQVRNEGIEGFGRAISKMSCLKSLRLDFDWCWKLGDDALENMTESIKSLLTLRTLRLNFSHCEGFTDQSFAKLRDSVQRLPFLESLSLIFRKNEKMTDEGLISIADSLQSLKNLHTIDINFFFCTKITEKGLDYLLEKLKACIDIKKVFLNFNMCPEIPKERLERMKTNSGHYRLETSR